MRKGSSAVLVLALTLLLAAPVADACRVRRPPSVDIAGVPRSCSEAFTARVSASGYPAVSRVEIRLDGRVIRRSAGAVRIPCDRLSGGRHEIRAEAENSNSARAAKVAFQAS